MPVGVGEEKCKRKSNRSGDGSILEGKRMDKERSRR